MHIPIVLKHKHLSELPGYEDLKDYIIFADGSLYSTKTHRFLNGCINAQGYRRIKFNNSKGIVVHRLVALAFIPNPNQYEIVDHIDRDRSNNSLINLRWTDMSGNSHNRSLSSNNTTGEDCIGKDTKRNGIYIYHYWKIRVHYGDKILYKCIPCGEFDTVIPKSVIELRDQFKKELHGQFANII
jgi:hypothetical protein